MNSTVTQLVASKRKPERINIFVDGEFALQVHIDLIAKYNVHKGKHWTPEIQTQLHANKRSMKVRQLALAYATYKMRSEAQVRTRLSQKECTVDEIEDAIDFLIEFGYLDDDRYARAFVRDKMLGRALSETKLKMDLMKRGIRADIAINVLRDLYPRDEALELARKAAAKKLNTISYRPTDKQKQALTSYLQRQGFAWGLIKTILTESFNSTASPDSGTEPD